LQNPEVVSACLQLDLNYLDNNETPLHVALSQKRIRAAKILIEAGADISLLNERKQSFLDVAMSTNDVDLTVLLLPSLVLTANKQNLAAASAAAASASSSSSSSSSSTSATSKSASSKTTTTTKSAKTDTKKETKTTSPPSSSSSSSQQPQAPQQEISLDQLLSILNKPSDLTSLDTLLMSSLDYGSDQLASILLSIGAECDVTYSSSIDFSYIHRSEGPLKLSAPPRSPFTLAVMRCPSVLPAMKRNWLEKKKKLLEWGIGVRFSLPTDVFALMLDYICVCDDDSQYGFAF
jgi:ankyrin repeat protein